jgi:hypothetical protein
MLEKSNTKMFSVIFRLDRGDVPKIMILDKNRLPIRLRNNAISLGAKAMNSGYGSDSLNCGT